MMKTRRIGEFEYNYEEVITKYTDEGDYIEKKTYRVNFIKVPSGESISNYQNNYVLIKFIHDLEQSGELDKVKTEYIGGVNDYGKITKPYEPPYTWCYEDGSKDSNVVLCNSNEHDAETRTHLGKNSFSRTRLSTKNLSS